MLDALLIQITTTLITYPSQKAEPQLGLYYIAEYAQQYGFKVGVKHFFSTDPIIHGVTSLLKEHSTKVLGFYVDSENIWTIRHVLYDIKKDIPNLIVVVGGPQITADAKLGLKRITYADLAIVGEGERPFTNILEHIKEGKDIYVPSPGIAFLSKNNKYIYGGDQQQLQLDVYPFPRRHEYSLDPDIEFDQISTGRGCVGKCAFCFEGSKRNNQLRLRSIECIIEEIDYMVNHMNNRKYIVFLDDTFILNTERTKAICNHFIEKYKGTIRWYCEARVDILYRNKELLPLMKEAGLCRIQLGGESGSQKVLNAYNKHMNICELKDVVKCIYEAGIDSIYINFIIGGAFETHETFNKTLELAKYILEIAPCCAEVGCSLFSPYVGTPMYLHPEEYGIKIIDKELLAGQDGNIPFVETKELNRYQIAKMYSVFQEEIEKKSYEIIIASSYDMLFKPYHLSQLGLSTLWYDKCERIPCIRNYFGSIVNYGFSSIRNLSIDELRTSIPYRTNQLVSDGEKYYRERFLGDYQENTKLQNLLLTLCSGKVSFSEIVTIIRNSYHSNDTTDLEQEIYDTFLQLDKEYLVIWKHLF